MSAIKLSRLRPPAVLPAVTCLAAVLLTLIGADAIDAYGEHLAQAAAAPGRPDDGDCAYVVPTYNATPGTYFPFSRN